MLENPKEYDEQKAINQQIKKVLIEKAEQRRFSSVQIDVLKRSTLQIGIHPGDIQDLITDDIENYLCQWCDHIVRQPLQCKDCTKKYCADCAAVLHVARYGGTKTTDDASKHRFLCSSNLCSPHGKGRTGPVTDIHWLEKYNATRQRCPRSGCRLWIQAPNMAIHLNQCKQGYLVSHTCWSLRAFSAEEFPVRASVAGSISHRLFALSRYQEIFSGKKERSVERPLQPGNPEQNNLAKTIKPVYEDRLYQFRRPRTQSPKSENSQRESSEESEPKRFKDNNMPHQISIIKDDKNQIIEFKSTFGMPSNQHQVHSILSTVESITKALVSQENFKVPDIPPIKIASTSNDGLGKKELNKDKHQTRNNNREKPYQRPSTSKNDFKIESQKNNLPTPSWAKKGYQSQRDLKPIWPVRSNVSSCAKEVKFIQERPQFIRRQNSALKSVALIENGKPIKYVTKPKEINTVPFNRQNYEDLMEDMSEIPVYYIDRFIEFVPIEQFDRIRSELKELSTFQSYTSGEIHDKYGSSCSLQSVSTYSISDAAKKRTKSEAARTRQNRWRYRQCRLAFKARPQVDSVAVPDSLREFYHKNLSVIRKNNIFCISIAVTTIRKEIDGYPKGYPCAAHVVICGANGRVLYETLVQHSNRRTILALGTSIHGLSYSHLKYARQIERVRKDVYKFLLAADIIIGHGIINHLNALNFTKSDISKISTKIRNVNSYYSPIPGQSLTLPVITYIVFSEIIDSSQYYPKVNAQVTMILYIIEQPKIENTKTLQNSVFGELYQWPPHQRVAEKIKYNHENSIAWPSQLYHRAIALSGQKTILIENRIPIPEDLINFPFEAEEDVPMEHDPEKDDFNEPNFAVDPTDRGGEELDETPTSEKKAGDSKQSNEIDWTDVIHETSLKETSFTQIKNKGKIVPTYREPAIYDSDASDNSHSRNSSPEPGYTVDYASALKKKQEMEEFYKQKSGEIQLKKLLEIQPDSTQDILEEICEKHRIEKAREHLKETRPELFKTLLASENEKVPETVPGSKTAKIIDANRGKTEIPIKRPEAESKNPGNFTTTIEIVSEKETPTVIDLTSEIIDNSTNKTDSESSTEQNIVPTSETVPETEPMEGCTSSDFSDIGLGPMISGQVTNKNSQTPEPDQEKEKEKEKETKEEETKEETEIAASETSEGILEELYILFAEEPITEFDENTVLAVDSELFSEFLGPEAGDLSCPEIAQPEQDPPLHSEDPE